MPLTRKTVASHIANTVRSCFNDHSDVWRLETDVLVVFEYVLLLGMRNVSEGSWQPILGYYGVAESVSIHLDIV